MEPSLFTGFFSPSSKQDMGNPQSSTVNTTVSSNCSDQKGIKSSSSVRVCAHVSVLKTGCLLIGLWCSGLLRYLSIFSLLPFLFSSNLKPITVKVWKCIKYFMVGNKWLNLLCEKTYLFGVNISISVSGRKSASCWFTLPLFREKWLANAVAR